MLDALEKDGSDLSHVRDDKDARGYTKQFHLDRELTETLVTGYSIPLRHKVIKRLHELEQSQSSPTVAVESPLHVSLSDLTKVVELTLGVLPNLSESSKQALLSELTAKAFGTRLLPLPTVTEHLMTATEVGEKLGISSYKVGRLANLHGLKTAEYGEVRLDKSRHSSKQVESFVYRASVLDKLSEILGDK